MTPPIYFHRTEIQDGEKRHKKKGNDQFSAQIEQDLIKIPHYHRSTLLIQFNLICGAK